MTAMSDEDENDQLDQMLSEHLHRRLDPQLGRASAAFEGSASASASSPSSRRWLIPSVAGAGGLIAAAVMIALPLLRDRPITRNGAPPKIVAVPTSPIPSTTTPQDELNFERLVLWRAVDEGASVVDSTVPVRKVRYEAVEQIEWEDPVDQATIQLSVPVAQVVLVQQPTF
jgi:hypothetical protein